MFSKIVSINLKTVCLVFHVKGAKCTKTLFSQFCSSKRGRQQQMIRWTQTVRTKTSLCDQTTDVGGQMTKKSGNKSMFKEKKRTKIIIIKHMRKQLTFSRSYDC